MLVLLDLGYSYVTKLLSISDRFFSIHIENKKKVIIKLSGHCPSAPI